MTSLENNNTEQKPMSIGKVGDRPAWVLTLSLFIRALHQIGAAVFLCFFLLKGLAEMPSFYLWLAVVSGILLILTEGMRHREIYRELSGCITFLKMVLIGLAYHGYLPGTATVVGAFILASVGAHAPKVVRHRLLW